jgi:WD40 repeat protein
VYLGCLRGDVIAFGGQNEAAVYLLDTLHEGPSLSVFDWGQGKLLSVQRTSPLLRGPAVTDTFLAMTSTDQHVLLWDLRAPAVAPVVLPGSGSGIVALGFDPSGKHLVGGGVNGTGIAWDPGQQRALEVVARSTPSPSLRTATSAGGNVRAISPDAHTIRLQNLATGGETAGPQLAPGEVIDDTRVDVTIPPGLSTGTYLPRPPLRFNPTGDALVVNLKGGGSIVFDVRGQREIGRLPEHVVAFSGDGTNLLVEHTATRSATLHRVADLASVATIGLEALPDDDVILPNAYALDQGGTRVAGTNATGTVVIWEAATGRSQSLPPGGSRLFTSFYDVTFSPDGTRLAVLSADQRIRLFRADGTTWNPVPVATAQPSTLISGFNLAFSPDGQLLAAEGHLWNGSSLEQIGPKLYPSFTQSLAFTVDGHLVAEAADSSEVVRWDVDAARLQARVCPLTDRSMTTEEWERFVPGNRPYHATCAP